MWQQRTRAIRSLQELTAPITTGGSLSLCKSCKDNGKPNNSKAIEKIKRIRHARENTLEYTPPSEKVTKEKLKRKYPKYGPRSRDKRNIWPQTRTNRHPAYRILPTGEGVLDLSFNWVNNTATRQRSN